jgi:hypothetical protein
MDFSPVPCDEVAAAEQRAAACENIRTAVRAASSDPLGAVYFGSTPTEEFLNLSLCLFSYVIIVMSSGCVEWEQRISWARGRKRVSVIGMVSELDFYWAELPGSTITLGGDNVKIYVTHEENTSVLGFMNDLQRMKCLEAASKLRRASKLRMTGDVRSCA